MYLQNLFTFSLVWTLGGTMNGNSRTKFDVFFRDLTNGLNDDYPKPKSVKINKVVFYSKLTHLKVLVINFFNIFFYSPRTTTSQSVQWCSISTSIKGVPEPGITGSITWTNRPCSCRQMQKWVTLQSILTTPLARYFSWTPIGVTRYPCCLWDPPVLESLSSLTSTLSRCPKKS